MLFIYFVVIVGVLIISLKTTREIGRIIGLDGYGSDAAKDLIYIVFVSFGMGAVLASMDVASLLSFDFILYFIKESLILIGIIFYIRLLRSEFSDEPSLILGFVVFFNKIKNQ